MADLPIRLHAVEVRAILREIEQPGTGKTQHREVLKPQPTRQHRLSGATAMTRFSSNGLAMSVADRLTKETGIKHVAVFAPRRMRDGRLDRTPFEVRREV